MKRILVADDSVTIQKVIALTFADEPFEVQSVGTGAEALELMKSFTPDIVLADVIMPQMNGYELCRAVKQQEGISDVPVLLLAGTFEAFDEGEAKSVGADDFITKPFESVELINKVKALLGEGAVPAAAPPQIEAPAVSAVPEPAPPMPEPVPPTPAVQPVPPVTAAPPAPDAGETEPDIWDILSDTGEEVLAPEAAPTVGGSDAGVPGFGPIEGTGVVDVGSFDVGLDRPEMPLAPEPVPPPPQIPVPPGPEPPQPEPVVVQPPAMSDVDAAEKSRVEGKEKDFFGFETDAVQEVAGADILSEAIEEVTFDMDDTPAASPGASPEASFVVPEPAGDQPQAAGETVAPDVMAPTPAPELASIPEPALEVEELSFQPAVVAAPAPPAAPPVPEVQVAEPAPAQEPAAPALAGGAGAADEAMVRKIIEEKVEKIAWEVVPEMADLFIREALVKI